MSPLVKKELEDGISLVLRLSSLRISVLRTVSLLGASCISHQHPWGPIALQTDSCYLDLYMDLMSPAGVLEIFPMTMNMVVNFIVILAGFEIV